MMINDIRPFKAWHYNPDQVSDIGRCLSHPYDVISDEMREAYYAADPHNFVRLILNKEEEGDNEEHNSYTRAGALLKQWQQEQVLIRADNPAFWIYNMEYKNDEEECCLQGFIGLVRLADFEEMRILPHEKILKGPYEDRIQLTKATRSQLEYIWGIYQDDQFAVDSCLKGKTEGSPLIEHLDNSTGVRHKLWKLEEKKSIKEISRIFEEKQIFIADGHHRYNTMLAIRNEMRKLYPEAGDNAPWEFMLMFLTNSSDRGLSVWPTHRLLHNLSGLDEAHLLKEIGHHFRIDQLEDTTVTPQLIGDWVSKVESCPEGMRRMGLYLPGGRFFILTMENTAKYLEQENSNLSTSSKLLDVNILNQLLLQKIIGISEEQLSLNTNLKYSVDPVEAVKQVEEGKEQLAFILNATPLQAVLDISLAKEVMPRKSTYFFPKPISGLVLYELKEF